MAAKRKNGAKPDTLLDAKRRALAEQQAKNEAIIAKKQKLIDDAPRVAAEAKKKREEAERQRRTRAEVRFGPRVLNDPRFVLEANASAAPRVLRKHRNQGMYLFFVLCLVLAAVLCWLYFKVLRAV